MMHDGRVIVEGTPDEIRANELVHDLYLGRGIGH
jgi:branched-chain amino acid transport system ATP-binding protein